MKVRWLDLKFVVVIFLNMLIILLQSSVTSAKVKSLSRKEALLVAESTKEVELFYQMYDGRLKNCIDKEVIKPCESDWVTCIENAWVVQFTVGEVCAIKHDGRLGITILIDALTGKVISRFPEAAYFENEKYCLESYDCLCVGSQESEGACKNFVFGQLSNGVDRQCGDCQCVNQSCQFRVNFIEDLQNR